MKITDAKTTASLSRRSAIGFGLAAGAFAVMPFSSASAASAKKRIVLRNLHTDEMLDTVYWRNGSYLKSAHFDINYIMRDWRQEEETRMDLAAVDFLESLAGRLRARDPVGIISGYRTPETNAMLAARSSGVAKKSYHIKGQAIDVRFDGFRPATVARTARAMGRGGVGLYTHSNFVHVDSGPVRHWGS